MERGAAGVLLIDPVVGRPGEKVRDEKCDAGVGANRIEGRVGLDTVQLDALAGFDEWQDADLRVAIWRGGDQRAVAHLGDESFGGFEVRWIIRARKHLPSLAPTRPA